MATIDNYKIKITVDGTDKVVDLNDEVEKLGVNIGKAAAAGIAAFAALGVSAVNMAADIDSLAKATGIATGDLYNLGRALEISGGQFDDAGRIFQAFARSLGQVERGSEEAIDSFAKLGVSKQELETLSDEALFNRVIQGLAGMENGFEKTQIAMTLLGKGAAGLEFDKLAANLNKSSDPEIARRFELAADSLDNITTAFRELQYAALQALTPILEQIAQFEFTAEDAKQAIRVFGALIAAAFAASTVMQMKKIIDLFKTMGAVIRGVAASQAFLVGLTGVGLAAVAAAGVAATAAYVALGEAMGDAADEQERLDGAAGAPDTDTGRGRNVGVTAEEKALAAIKEQTRQMRLKNEEANKYQRLINDTIGLSQDEANLIRTMADLERQAGNEKQRIEAQINAELAKGADTNQAIVIELQKQLTEVDKQLGIQKQLKAEEQSRLVTQKEILNAIQMQSDEETAIFDITKKRFSDAINMEKARGNLTERQAKIAEKLGTANLRYWDQAAKLQSDYDKALEQGDLDALDRIDTLQNINKERWRFELQSIADAEAADTIRIQNYGKGMSDAIENIAKSFQPYEMAQKAVLQTWGNIASAIDRFVETGKFSFRDFAASVLQDLAKMIAQALVFKYIFEPIMGKLGLKIPGMKAKGGPVQGNTPYIVGEKGPELFVPKSAGNIIPNNKLGMAAQGTATGTVNAPVNNTYNTYNISALDAKSVAQLFAENRKSLLGSITMAQKELPYSMG